MNTLQNQVSWMTILRGTRAFTALPFLESLARYLLPEFECFQI